MSLTNPKDVVTEERLKDFYDGIYPYLGGMPEILANKFSRSDIYSTTEKMIGVWTDGKPIYQKVVAGSISASGTYTTLISTLIPNIGSLLSNVILGSPDNGILQPLPIYNASYSALKLSAEVKSKNTDTQISITNTWEANAAYYAIILQYTKTTDSAISIGSDTDYSTTEKIVGTDTDGKWIYQKTWTNLTTPSSAGNGTILTLANVNVMKSWGYVTNGNNRYEFPWYIASDNYCYIWTSGNGTSSVGIKCSMGGSSSFLNKPIRLTLQYTKTS